MLKPNALTGAALALAVAVGAALTWWGTERGTGYTEPSGNPRASATWATPTSPERRPQPQDFAFTGPDGSPGSISALTGKVVLVNLWATWCPPCVAEMPDLDALQAKLGGDGFQVLAISLDRGGAPVAKRWLERAGLRHLTVNNADPAHFPGAMLPTSFLLDAKGRVAWRGVGARDWSGPEAVAAVRGVMGE